ncbi:type IV pilus secretin PilQ [Methylomarinum vadi]|uniref:type IV pilus secretin PilQ n=1 Tax=Methylomarinum vadi TaxID=438855 RepID=UPI0004DFA3BB|nr:type IV pilus secretin PilQ [Methylomarinum vadi]
MNTKQKNKFWGLPGRAQFGWLALTFALLLQAHSVSASEKAIESLQFTSLAGNKVQLQLEMNEPVAEPKIFQTDNPARIALDFAGVKSHLSKKSFPINQGAATTLYVVEAGGRTRVVINLNAAVDYQTKAEGNSYYVVLNAAKSVGAGEQAVKKQLKQTNISKLIPQQTIKGIDFRRGPHGEGRLLLALSNPNTVVDVKEKGGKVVLNFLNTKLTGALAKSYDVIDFATPVRRVDARSRGTGATITVTTVDENFDYSTFQAEGLLTVEFRPVSVEEKAALLKDKFPFTGDKLSLNFQDIEVRSVLQILADFTDLNIIASDSVGGNVTLRLNDVPWDQALALVLKSKGLAKRESGNVVFVAPATEITQMEEDELAANKIVEELEPLVTEYIQINYAKAEDFSKMLFSRGQAGGRAGGAGGVGGVGGAATATGVGAGVAGSRGINDDERRLISRRGNVIVDPRTNTLIVKDTADRLVEIRKMIKLLDIPVRQVLIESRIVIATTLFARNLGVKFGVAQKADINGGKQFGYTGTGVETSDTSQILADLGGALAASSGGSLAMTLARGADYLLNLEISALQDDSLGELLSNPRVMTTDRVQAVIRQGVQIPYVTVSQDGTKTELVDAVLELQVTPQITPNGSVIMELNIKKDSPGADTITTGGAASTPIDTREVNTTIQVDDGETVVLGGIYESETNNLKNTVPWLADLPGIGWLFKRTEKRDDKRELLVFVTPKIVKPSLSAY